MSESRIWFDVAYYDDEHGWGDGDYVYEQREVVLAALAKARGE